MEKKKVAYVITKSNWGGAQRYVFDVAHELAHELEVVVALGGTGQAGAEAGRLVQQLDAAGIRNVFIKSFMREISLAQEFGALGELVKFFKTERPDVVHLNSSKAGGVGALAARLAGVKNIIFTSHGLAWDEDRNVISKILIYIASRITFLLCHKVITITENDRHRVPGSILIHNGIAPIEFLIREEARAALKISPDAFVIGTIGELTWNKGYHHLIRAAGLLKEQGKNFEIFIVGEGEEHGFLETLIEEEGLKDKVHLAGFVPEGAKYLKAFDIFALASVKEGLPYVLMEAGQAGLPVVATNVGGVSDIVGDKISGLLVKPKDPHNLADKLKKLIESEPERYALGQALKSRVEQEFSITKMVEQTKALY